MIQLRLADVKPRSAWIVGRATVTIVPSRIVMSDAAHKMISAARRELDMRPLHGRMTPPLAGGDNWKLADYLIADNLLSALVQLATGHPGHAPTRPRRRLCGGTCRTRPSRSAIARRKVRLGRAPSARDGRSWLARRARR